MRDLSKFASEIAMIEQRLVDDISKEYFDARLRKMVYRNNDIFLSDILNIAERNKIEWRIFQLDQEMSNGDFDGIVIWGCGVVGELTYRLIKNSKYNRVKVLFCDNNSNLWNKEVYGERVISPEDLTKEYNSYLCIIGSNRYRQSIFEQLISIGFPKQNILYPQYGRLYAYSGWQYFDYFTPRENEIFIDGGAYDGNTAGGFSEWCNGKYDKIYGFEANLGMISMCKKYYADNLKNAKLIEKGMWCKKTHLSFDRRTVAQSSRLSSDGEEMIEVDSIDNVLAGEGATFIKMDIEGAEYNALIGASNTIKKYHPRMAISIYHKTEDIYEIPALILEMDSSYRFAIRQYTSNGDETILYAF